MYWSDAQCSGCEWETRWLPWGGARREGTRWAWHKEDSSSSYEGKTQGTSGNPAVLGVNDELTPRQQTADMQKSSHMSRRGGHPPLVHLCYFDSEGIKYTANT